MTEPQAEVNKYEAFAERKVRSICSFVIEPETETALAAKLREMQSEVAAMQPDVKDPTKQCLIFYSVPESGEAVTAPHVRSCPFRIEHAKNILFAIMKSRCSEEKQDAPQPRDQDVYAFLDGGKQVPTGFAL